MLQIVRMAAAVAACSFVSFNAAAPTTSNASASSAGTWEACQSPLPSNIDCADVTVPMDYDNPDDETITLKLLRLPARNQGARVGSLVFQYGGPGVITSNSILAEAANSSLAAFYGMEEYFDIVVADPRGVGLNYDVKCDPKFDDLKFNYFPRDEKEYLETLAMFRELGASCLKRRGKVMKYMDSLTQAKDLEAVRVAIGEGGLNYYGVSWGSLRGQLYAEMYPDNIRSMILDGVVDHSVSTSQLYASNAAAFSMTQRRMLEWMEKSPDSVLQGRNVQKLWADLIEKADESPIPAPDCVESNACSPEVTGNDLRGAAFNPTNNPDLFWEGYAELYRLAFDDNNVTALSPKYLTPETEIQGYGSQLAIICQDWDWKSSSSWPEFEKLQYMSASMTLDTQSTTGARIWALGCAAWPTEVRNPPKALKVQKTSNPILFVHALWDPATGYDAAISVHRQFNGSLFVTRYGEGHGSEWDPDTVKVMIEYLADPTGMNPKSSILTSEPFSPMGTDFEAMGWGSE